MFQQYVKRHSGTCVVLQAAERFLSAADYSLKDENEPITLTEKSLNDFLNATFIWIYCAGVLLNNCFS